MEKLLDKIYKCNCDDFALSLELLKDCITEEQPTSCLTLIGLPATL